MNLCLICRSPGACCSNFVLSIRFDKVNWEEEARQEMERRGLPFYPVGADVMGDIVQPGKVAVRFKCRWLGPDGRCSHYYERPNTCRLYQAGTDYLCAEHVPVFNGIPVIVEGRR